MNKSKRNGRCSAHRFLTLLVSLFLSATSSFTQYTQNRYVDLKPIIQSPTKAGWTLEWSDELNGSYDDDVWQNGFCWAGEGQAHPDAAYFLKDENLIPTPSYLRIMMRKQTFTPPGHYIEKKYTTAMLNSDPCASTTEEMIPNLWTYGYFEIRCKNPRAQMLASAFWLYGEGNEVSDYNEIDVFEVSSTDACVMSNHGRPNDEVTNVSKARWVYALPGQSFGGTWVVYSVKWEPNKIIWYINNKPVRIQTDHQEVIIPSSSMRVKVQCQVDERFLSHTYFLPKIFPNEMQVDNVRIFQRADHFAPDPVFNIEGRTGTANPMVPLQLQLGTTRPLVLNASESYMPNHDYFFSIQKCNSSGTLSGTEAMGWINDPSTETIRNLDLKAFAASHGLTLVPNQEYRVKVAGSAPWTENIQYIYLSSCSNLPRFMINGVSESGYAYPTAVEVEYNFRKPKIIVDASATASCTGDYFLSVQMCNSAGVGTGTEFQKWLTAEEKQYLHHLDVEKIAAAGGFTFAYGLFYRIKIAVGGPWTEKVRIIRIEPCTSTISFNVNGLSTPHPQAIVIPNGGEILVDGSASKICGEHYFCSIIECTSAGESFGIEKSIWKPYVDHHAVDQVYWYSIGKFDVRQFCLDNNFPLNCGSYYLLKMATSEPWIQRTNVIYIQPCTDVNSTFLVNGSSANEHEFGDPGDQPVTLYSPDGVSCSRSFHLSVQKRVNGVLTGTIAQDWLTQYEIFDLTYTGYLRLQIFAAEHGLTLAPNSTYVVKLTAGVGPCSTASPETTTKVVIFGTGSGMVEQSDPTPYNAGAERSVSVFPNPANNEFIITADLLNGTTEFKYDILDGNGKIVLTGNSNSQYAYIHSASLAAGIYYVRVDGDDEKTMRLVIE